MTKVLRLFSSAHTTPESDAPTTADVLTHQGWIFSIQLK